MAAVRHGDMCAGKDARSVGRELGGKPVRFASELRRRNVRIVARVYRSGEQRREIKIMAQGVELRHRRDQRGDLIGIAGQRGDQLGIVESRCRRREPDLHQGHRVRRQLKKSGVAVVDRGRDALGEVNAMPQALLPVVDIVNRVTAGPDVAALVHGGEVADRQRVRGDPLKFGRQLSQQRIHLGGVTRALGRELSGELPFRLGAGDDGINLLRRATDDGLSRRGVNAHLQIREVGEYPGDLLGGVFDQCHQPDVLAEQHGLALTHQVRSRANGPGRVGQRQPASEVGRGSLAQGLPNHRSGFRPVVAQQFSQGDLDRKDGHLGGLDAVVLGIVEDQFDDRVSELILDQGIDLIDPVSENLVTQIQALAHLAMLGAEAGQHPHRSIADGAVGAVDQWTCFSFGDRPEALDGLVVVVGHHYRARTTVIAPRQCAAYRFQWRRPTGRAVDPIRQHRRGRLLARC